MNADGAIRLVYRVRAEVRHDPLRRCLVFVRSAFHAVVHREPGSVGAHDSNNVMAIPIEERNPLRVIAKRPEPAAIRAHVVDGDERPGAYELVRERLLLGDGIA